MRDRGIICINGAWYVCGPVASLRSPPELILGPLETRGEALESLYYPDDNPRGFRIPTCEFAPTEELFNVLQAKVKD